MCVYNIFFFFKFLLLLYLLGPLWEKLEKFLATYTCWYHFCNIVLELEDSISFIDDQCKNPSFYLCCAAK